MCPVRAPQRDREKHVEPPLTCATRSTGNGERECSLVIHFSYLHQLNNAHLQHNYGIMEPLLYSPCLCILESRTRTRAVFTSRDVDSPRWRPSRPSDRTCIDVFYRCKRGQNFDHSDHGGPERLRQRVHAHRVGRRAANRHRGEQARDRYCYGTG